MSTMSPGAGIELLLTMVVLLVRPRSNMLHENGTKMEFPPKMLHLVAEATGIAPLAGRISGDQL